MGITTALYLAAIFVVLVLALVKILPKIKKEDVAFDHYKIIEDYLKYKKQKGTYWSTRR